MKTGSVILMEVCIRLRNKVNSVNTRLKRAYCSEKISASEGNLTEPWNAINQLINKRSKTTIVSSLTGTDKSVTKIMKLQIPAMNIFATLKKSLVLMCRTRFVPL